MILSARRNRHPTVVIVRQLYFPFRPAFHIEGGWQRQKAKRNLPQSKIVLRRCAMKMLVRAFSFRMLLMFCRSACSVYVSSADVCKS